MKRLMRVPRDLALSVRAWRAKHRMRAEFVLDLMTTVRALEDRVARLETDLDEFRADSRRIAELRIQVEDLLVDHG